MAILVHMTYVFSHRWQAINLPGFPIQKSTDRCLLAAPRSLSQLATSFIGVWCHGIHPVLLLAWFFRRLILRPIVCYFEVSIDRTFVQPLLRIATGLHIESLFVQLSRCRQFVRTAFRFCCQTLKAIQTQNAIIQQLPMRRCASTDLPRGNSACSATLLPCFICLLGSSYGRLS